MWMTPERFKPLSSTKPTSPNKNATRINHSESLLRVVTPSKVPEWLVLELVAGGAGALGGGAKRGPKPDPNAPHNKKIREVAQALIAAGNKILHGGGVSKERLFNTFGGKKMGGDLTLFIRIPMEKFVLLT